MMNALTNFISSLPGTVAPQPVHAHPLQAEEVAAHGGFADVLNLAKAPVPTTLRPKGPEKATQTQPADSPSNVQANQATEAGASAKAASTTHESTVKAPAKPVTAKVRPHGAARPERARTAAKTDTEPKPEPKPASGLAATPESTAGSEPGADATQTEDSLIASTPYGAPLEDQSPVKPTTGEPAVAARMDESAESTLPSGTLTEPSEPATAGVPTMALPTQTPQAGLSTQAAAAPGSAQFNPGVAATPGTTAAPSTQPANARTAGQRLVGWQDTQLTAESAPASVLANSAKASSASRGSLRTASDPTSADPSAGASGARDATDDRPAADASQAVLALAVPPGSAARLPETFTAHHAARPAPEALGLHSAAITPSAPSDLPPMAASGEALQATEGTGAHKVGETALTPSATPAFGTRLTEALGHRPGATSGGPVEVRVPAQVGSPEFAPAIGLTISTLAANGVQEARLQLHPSELGPITVQITVEGTGARVDFQAEVAQTRQAIEASLPSLAGSLREAGLTLTGGGVSQQSQQPGQASATGDRQGKRNGSGDDELTGIAAPQRALARRGLVDLMA